MALTEQTRADAVELAGRYPQSRSALLPLLHLVQSAEGTVTPDGIALCADVVGLTTAEVAAVATFYTMYKRHKVGRYHVGVCTNTLCAVLGGDAIWGALSERLGVGHDEVTADGLISLERIECQAACTHGPVMTANWEFLDDMDVPRALEVVEPFELVIFVDDLQRHRAADRASVPDAAEDVDPIGFDPLPAAATVAPLASCELAHPDPPQPEHAQASTGRPTAASQMRMPGQASLG